LFHLESTLTHCHYNTIHSASSDQRKYHYVPLTSLFSTRVITGAKSTPDLNKLLERKQAGLIGSESTILAPLETLNTNLNYKILDEFLGKVTDPTSKSILKTTKTRFHVEYVDHQSPTRLPYPINTINELPEKTLEDER